MPSRPTAVETSAMSGRPVRTAPAAAIGWAQTAREPERQTAASAWVLPERGGVRQGSCESGGQGIGEVQAVVQSCGGSVSFLVFQG